MADLSITGIQHLAFFKMFEVTLKIARDFLQDTREEGHKGLKMFRIGCGAAVIVAAVFYNIPTLFCRKPQKRVTVVVIV